jgi:hypothetical protein
VVAFPLVVQPAMVDDVGTVWLQVAGWLGVGGPTVPVFMMWVPLSLPLLGPVLGIVVMANGEQLTGMSLPRNKTTGWAVSALHCSMEARDPGENPVPDTLTTSPLASPEQMGAEGLLLSHEAPAAEVVRDSVVVAAPLTPATLVATIAPPAITATTPTVVMRVMSRECLDGRGASIADPTSAAVRHVQGLDPDT